MTNKSESWSVGKGDIPLYIEDPQVAKTVKRLVGRGAAYERAGRVYAWHFVLPKNRRAFVERQISKKFSLVSKLVTGAANFKFDHTAAPVVEVEELPL